MRMSVWSSISGKLIRFVRELVFQCLEEVKDLNAVRQGLSVQSGKALPGYICAAASVEAFVNELFLGIGPRVFDSSLLGIREDILEGLRLTSKLALLPRACFGKGLDFGTSPMSDMQTLVTIRNEILHYKPGQEPRCVKDLEQKGYALKPTLRDGKKFPWTWPDRISTSEGVRWAHNVACRTVQELVDFAKEWGQAQSEAAEVLVHMFGSMATSFVELPESEVEEWYRVNKIVV